VIARSGDWAIEEQPRGASCEPDCALRSEHRVIEKQPQDPSREERAQDDSSLTV